MQYSGHLAIADIFSWNQPYHSQCLIENTYIADTFIAYNSYGGRKFLALREKLKSNLPLYSEHPIFFAGK